MYIPETRPGYQGVKTLIFICDGADFTNFGKDPKPLLGAKLGSKRIMKDVEN